MVDVIDLYKYFTTRRTLIGRTSRMIKAVDGVSFSIPKSRTLGLVGESGSGKTTLGKLLLGILLPDKGNIVIESRSIYKNKGIDRGALFDCQYIFQDPFSSLDPKMKARDIITEGLTVRGISGERRRARLHEILEMVRLSRNSQDKYPHEFSGGQRQRIAIARAIITNPKFIVCDEPVSSLDVSIQAQILNLLKELQALLGLTYLFISHDLSVIEYMADEVAVMYQGKIVESGSKKEIYYSPKHPYTKRLIDSVLQIPV